MFKSISNFSDGLKKQSLKNIFHDSSWIVTNINMKTQICCSEHDITCTNEGMLGYSRDLSSCKLCLTWDLYWVQICLTFFKKIRYGYQFSIANLFLPYYKCYYIYSYLVTFFII